MKTFAAFAEVNFADGTTFAFSRTGFNAADAAARLGMAVAHHDSIFNHNGMKVWPEILVNELDAGADPTDFHFIQEREERTADVEEMFQAEQQAARFRNV